MFGYICYYHEDDFEDEWVRLFDFKQEMLDSADIDIEQVDDIVFFTTHTREEIEKNF